MSVGASISRRGFFATGIAAGAVAGIAASGIGQNSQQVAQAYSFSEDMSAEELAWEVPDDPIDASEIVKTVDCDVVVAGAGLAGLPCAVRLAYLGVNVHVVEKGPTFAFPRAVFTAINSQTQQDAGETWDQDTVDAYVYKHIQSRGYLNISYDVVRETMEESGPCLDFYKPIFEDAGIGVNYIGNTAFLVPDLSEPPTPDWMEPLAAYAEANGATFHYSEPAKQLVTDEAGNVCGIITQNAAGQYIQYNTKGGVILATGGIDRDYEFSRRYVPNFDKLTHDFCYKNDTGDGHKMAIWVGADYETLGCTEPFLCSDRKTQVRALVEGTDCTMCIGWPQQPAVGTLPTLWVNDAGYRCMNEHDEFVGMFVANGVLSQPNGKVWTIWDSAWADKMPEDYKLSYANGGAFSEFATEGPLTSANMSYWFTENSQRQIDLDVENGITLKCDTLEELAEAMGVDADVLAETVAHYNEVCAEGADHEFYKPAKWLQTVDTPPFYAAHVGVANCCTRLGLRRNGKSQVVDHDGKGIGGLYAIGNTGGGFYGAFNIPEPMSVSKAQIDGWMAANAVYDVLEGTEGWQPGSETVETVADGMTELADERTTDMTGEEIGNTYCAVSGCHGDDIWDFEGDEHEIEQMVERMGADLSAAQRQVLIDFYESL